MFRITDDVQFVESVFHIVEDLLWRDQFQERALLDGVIACKHTIDRHGYLIFGYAGKKTQTPHIYAQYRQPRIKNERHRVENSAVASDREQQIGFQIFM